MRSPRRAALCTAGVIALAGGLAAGVLDLGGGGVQGPALVLMLGAFAGTFAATLVAADAPAWTGVAAAVASVLGLIAVHARSASAGMLVALVPALIAAVAGHAAGAIVRRVGDELPRGTAGSGALLGAALAACAAAGLVPVWATLAARGQPVTAWVALWWQLATLVGWTAAVPWVVRRARTTALDVPARAPTPADAARAAGLVVMAAAAHAAALVALTRLLFVPLGAASTGAAVAWAFAAYLPLDALVYVLVAAVARTSDAERLAAETARRHAALSAAAVESRLAALTAQIRPHFLFNALNAALVLARRGDAAATARVLADLAELLRYVLAAGAPDDTVPLGDELAFVARYLEIERVRFSDRLRPTIDAGAEARDALVPRLVLQPLVENAVRHGVAGRIGAGAVSVRAWCDGDRLRVTVSDDGPGPGAGGTDGTGVGLANTRARLAVLYGGAASLALRAGDVGGAVAELALPLRRAAAAGAA